MTREEGAHAAMTMQPPTGDREERRATERAVIRAIFGLSLMVCGALLACSGDDRDRQSSGLATAVAGPDANL
jgi:hypothetical protein